MVYIEEPNDCMVILMTRNRYAWDCIRDGGYYRYVPSRRMECERYDEILRASEAGDCFRHAAAWQRETKCFQQDFPWMWRASFRRLTTNIPNTSVSETSLLRKSEHPSPTSMRRHVICSCHPRRAPDKPSHCAALRRRHAAERGAQRGSALRGHGARYPAPESPLMSPQHTAVTRTRRGPGRGSRAPRGASRAALVAATRDADDCALRPARPWIPATVPAGPPRAPRAPGAGSPVVRVSVTSSAAGAGVGHAFDSRQRTRIGLGRPLAGQLRRGACRGVRALTGGLEPDAESAGGY